MDTHERLRQLLNERGWTEYRLAKKLRSVRVNGCEYFQEKYSSLNRNAGNDL